MTTIYEPLVLIASTNIQAIDKLVHPHSLARAFAACTYKVWIETLTTNQYLDITSARAFKGRLYIESS